MNKEYRMSTELFWLTLTAVLAGSLWIPYIIGINVTDYEGKTDQFIRPPDHRNMRPWVHRSLRAHQNLLEQLLPFSLVVLVAAIAKVSTPVTATCAMLFFWLRVTHAAGMISGLARFPLRPIIYVAGWVIILVFVWQVLATTSAG
jgi:uncharacterized MAPEG superfamily protein